jgi:hypothetical protein
MITLHIKFIIIGNLNFHDGQFFSHLVMFFLLLVFCENNFKEVIHSTLIIVMGHPLQLRMMRPMWIIPGMLAL